MSSDSELPELAEAEAGEAEGRFAGLATAWALALGAGTAFLHAVGYLSLRFRLRALGVEVDHAVIDERFLFEGASCVLQFVTTLPLLLLLGSPLAVLVALSRRLPALGPRLGHLGQALWHAPPRWLALAGGAWAVLAVQLVLRQVVGFQNLLLAPLPCDPRWLHAALLDTSGRLRPFCLAGLVALVVPTAFAVARLRQRAWRPARVLLGLLLVGQLVLLPVHHGILGAAAPVARVDDLTGEPAGSRAWKVFAGDETTVFLVERPAEAGRRLVSLQNESLERLEVVGWEPLLERLQQGERCR